MEIDRNGLEVLGREECYRLLERRSIGRIGLTSGALPMVVPVSYAVAGDSIVMRTGRNTKLAAATQKTVVAFEVDDVDPVAQTGWSVLVGGFAEEVTDPEELEACRLLPLGRWGDSGDRFVRISTDLISGRRAGVQFAAVGNGLQPAPEVVC